VQHRGWLSRPASLWYSYREALAADSEHQPVARPSEVSRVGSSHRGSGRRLAAIAAALVASVALAIPVGAAAVTARATGRTGGGTHSPAAGQRVGHGKLSAVIVRDSYGVPSIYAKSMAGMWFGDGWAQAQDRMVQLELTRRAVEGTLSALFGSAELAQDEDVRTFFYTPAEVRAQYLSLPAVDRAALKAFAAGINAYEASAYRSASTEKAKVPLEFFVLGLLLGQKQPYRPAPWSPVDTVAVGDYLAREFGTGGGSELQNLSFLNYLKAELAKHHDAQAAKDAVAVFNDARWIDDPTAPTTVPSGPAAGVPPKNPSPDSSVPSAGTTASQLAALDQAGESAIRRAAATLAADRKSILATGVSMDVLSHGGSNAFVVAPWRSADHHALLWGAPQEGFTNPSVDWEVYLHGPRGYDAGGMTITGEPFVLIGRNGSIAWTSTSEENVDERIYLEKVNFSASPPTYEFDGKQVPMTVIHEKIPVQGKAAVPFTVYRTIDGPVFSTDKASGVAFSLRFASWLRETGSLIGFSQLGGDTNLRQFTHSMSLITTLHNFLYADNRGNIAYFGDGLVPIEPPFSKVDPRLPALGNGTEQWHGFVPFAQMPHSINPAQGYLDNWNTKPSQQAYYQQNEGDEYWGTIFRSTLISQMLAANSHVTVGYLEKIEHAIGTIDDEDNTRPAAPYFIPYVIRAYRALVAAHSALTDPKTHPDLAPAVAALAHWNGVTTQGSPAMSIFMNFLEAFERNVFEGGTFRHERYTGAVNFSDASLGMGTFGGLGGMGTYNLLYHILAGTRGLVPCGTLCYRHSYFRGHEDQLLVESVNDAIKILSGTGTQLGQDVPGFGTSDIAKWGYRPAENLNWTSLLDPLAIGVTTKCGVSAAQNRSTFMMAVDVGPAVTGQDLMPPGESGFISLAHVPSPHMCDQVKRFNNFTYKPMPKT
jgi:penicillin G amidase